MCIMMGQHNDWTASSQSASIRVDNKYMDEGYRLAIVDIWLTQITTSPPVKSFISDCRQ